MQELSTFAGAPVIYIHQMHSDRIVYIWWACLSIVALLNIWSWWSIRKLAKPDRYWQTIFSGFYVFGCAYRTLFPRIDAQRIVIFDSWLSSIFLGRLVATVAEVAFVCQLALMVRDLSRSAQKRIPLYIAHSVVPLILVAEFWSWYSVLTQNFLGHTIEESIWALVATLLSFSIVSLWTSFAGLLRRAFMFALVFSISYVTFMVYVDVPMYFARWQADQAQNKASFGIYSGFWDSLSRRTTSSSIDIWIYEIPWMTLYFAAAVWFSLSLILVPRFKPDRSLN